MTTIIWPQHNPPENLPITGVVSAFFIRHTIQLGRKLGVPADPLMHDAHVTEEDLNPVDGWVRQDVLERLLEHALKHWQDPVVSLRLVMSMEPAMMGLVGYIMQCCPTLLDMHQAIAEFGQLVSTLHTLYMTHEPGAALWCVEVHSNEDFFVRHSEESYLAAWAQLVRRQNPDALLAVRFRHSPTLHGNAPHPIYRKAFPCPVSFNQYQSALVLDPQYLNQPLPYADPFIYESLRQQARTMVQKLGAEPRLANRVKDALRQLMARGIISRQAVAGELGISPRHLHRLLQEQGSHYQSILDELRSELAHKYLLQPSSNLEDIALRLGFSNASSFSRWFRQETGITPLDFRRETVSG
jgi:AraC-like DNA-binding protein